MKLTAFALAFSLLAGGTYDRSDWISPSKWRTTRTKILNRDQVNGTWTCKYSGIQISESRMVDIDHIIPLKYANDIGGSEFTPTLKQKFATDDSNLVSVSQHENRSKGDAGLSGYLPQNNTCFYLRHWKYISTKYKLHLPRKDSTILAKGLKTCKDK